MVCLPPVGILNQVMFIYHYLFTLVLKSPNGEWPITYTFTYTYTRGLKRLFPRVRKSIRDCDWMKKFPYEFFMRSILSENLSKYEINGKYATGFPDVVSYEI